MTTTANPRTAAEIDFTFDVATIASLIGQLSDADRKTLFQRLGVRPAPKPRITKSAAEPYVPATGDERLDAFMAAHHNPAWKPWQTPQPRKATTAGARHLGTAERFEHAAADRWRERGYTVNRDAGAWSVIGDGDGSYQRQMTAAYVQTASGWTHPDDVFGPAR